MPKPMSQRARRALLASISIWEDRLAKAKQAVFAARAELAFLRSLLEEK